ncbi:MAG: hypothetical protein ACRDBY_14345 [Cetobacterium sp.]
MKIEEKVLIKIVFGDIEVREVKAIKGLKAYNKDIISYMVFKNIKTGEEKIVYTIDDKEEREHYRKLIVKQEEITIGLFNSLEDDRIGLNYEVL